MSKRILFASMCVLASCTPHQEIDRDAPPGRHLLTLLS